MKRHSRASLFLIWASGADLNILNDCHPSVTTTKKAQGLLVLIPAIIALAAGYSFFATLFKHEQLAAFGFGAIWSLIVFTIDRYLLMTLNKTNSVIKDLFSLPVLLRIIIAGYIGFVMAHPLLLMVYKDNLHFSLETNYNNQAQIISNDFDRKIEQVQIKLDKRNNDLGNIRDANLTILNQKPSSEQAFLLGLIKEQQILLRETEAEFEDEVAGISQRTGKKGFGPIALAIKKKIKNIEKDKEKLETQLNNNLKERRKAQRVQHKRISNELDQIDHQRLLITNDLKSLVNDKGNLKKEKGKTLKDLDSIEAFDFLTLSNELHKLEENNPNVFLWKWLITGLLWTLDILVILLKITSPRDDYDEIKDLNKIAFNTTKPIRLEAITQNILFTEQKRSLDKKISFHLNNLDTLLKQSELIMKKVNYLNTISEKNSTPNSNATFKDIFRGYTDVASMTWKKIMDEVAT